MGDESSRRTTGVRKLGACAERCGIECNGDKKGSVAIGRSANGSWEHRYAAVLPTRQCPPAHCRALERETAADTTRSAERRGTWTPHSRRQVTASLRGPATVVALLQQLSRRKDGSDALPRPDGHRNQACTSRSAAQQTGRQLSFRHPASMFVYYIGPPPAASPLSTALGSHVWPGRSAAEDPPCRACAGGGKRWRMHAVPPDLAAIARIACQALYGKDSGLLAPNEL
ncbi:hypothetical protein PHYPSEUDO_013668 [Phytophthora pseudosyringae]|uniref:Uncharacterized protein n=1 Tax=Phytophthora pseudosyringae TaxID=221518 RepID=A0A8T1V5R3_9STRA|nr:hypothetical protein PHYPSEUDO_013668 [Phytophthora pseudosyringae]